MKSIEQIDNYVQCLRALSAKRAALIECYEQRAAATDALIAGYEAELADLRARLADLQLAVDAYAKRTLG